jgi:hypothetical protein
MDVGVFFDAIVKANQAARADVVAKDSADASAKTCGALFVFATSNPRSVDKLSI